MSTNSSLVQFVRISPNRSYGRTHTIDTVTIHCAFGNFTVEEFGEIYSSTQRQTSCTYAIGVDGKIGQYVEERDTSWSTSNSANDSRSISIQVSCSSEYPYEVCSEVLKSLILLMADIARRNGLEKYKWTGRRQDIGKLDIQNVTVHRWFSQTACPGKFLHSRLAYIVEAANVFITAPLTITCDTEVILANFGLEEIIRPNSLSASEDNSKSFKAAEVSESFSDTLETKISAGDVIKVIGDTYYTGMVTIPNWVKNSCWIVKSVIKDKVELGSQYNGYKQLGNYVRLKDVIKVGTTERFLDPRKRS